MPILASQVQPQQRLLYVNSNLNLKAEARPMPLLTPMGWVCVLLYAFLGGFLAPYSIILLCDKLLCFSWASRPMQPRIFLWARVK
jgi:hypothetical protein